MSKKFHDRLLRSSGVQTRPFHSNFGASLLKKFGWEEGQGLGKHNTGRVDCLQIRRREENVGLGHEDASETKAQDQWKNWWDGLYNSMAAKLRATTNERRVSQNSTSSSDSDGDEVLPVKPLYGKRSFLNAARSRPLQKEFTPLNDKETITVVEPTCSSHREHETKIHVEKQDTDANLAKRSAYEQQKKGKESRASCVNGGSSTTTCAPVKSCNSPPCSDGPALSTSESSVGDTQSSTASCSLNVVSTKLKRKKKKEREGCEAVSDVAVFVEKAPEVFLHAAPCAPASHRDREERRKNGDFLPPFGLEAQDVNATRICCRAVSRIEASAISGCADNSVVYKSSSPPNKTEKRSRVQGCSDRSTGERGGEEILAECRDTRSEDRCDTVRVEQKRVWVAKSVVTEGKSDTEDGAAERDEDDMAAGVKKKKKKRKIESNGTGETAEEKKRNHKQPKTVHIS